MSDEEAGGEYGAKYLIENHADLFKSVRYALGEFGGFSMTIAGHRFYPIMVAEQVAFQVRAIVRGPGGHSSLPLRGGAMAKLGKVLQQLDQQRLPVHVLPVPQQMIETFFARLGIQTYGFLPMTLPDRFHFPQTIHAADERIPIEALNFGAKAIYEVLRNFGDT